MLMRCVHGSHFKKECNVQNVLYLITFGMVDSGVYVVASKLDDEMEDVPSDDDE